MSLRKVVLIVTILSAFYGAEYVGAVPPATYVGNKMEARYDCTSKPGATQNITISIALNHTVISSSLDTYAISKTDFNYNLVTNTDDDKKSCFQGLTNIDSTPNISLTNCDKGVTLYLHLLKLRTPLIFDGKDEVLKLNCLGGAHVLYDLKNEFSITDITAKEKEEIPNLKLTMTIKRKPAGDGNIYIGDTVTVTVTESSSPKQYLAFVDCFADNTAGKKITLITKGIKDPTGLIAAVDNWQAEGLQEMDMSAFRFEGTPAKVRIQCKIMACNDKMCTFTSRKRRSTNDGITHMVEATYTVSDKKVASGQDKAITNFVLMSILLLVSKLG